MTRELSDDDMARHDALYQRGWNLCREQLHAGDAVAPRLNWLARRKLRSAIGCFQAALQIHPAGWPSMWALGKIYQRLGDPGLSLKWFQRAHEINPSHPDVAREGGLAAMDQGDGGLAVRLCSAAVSSDPDDPGLMANLALAHMMDGNDALALDCAERALRMNPQDGVSVTVRDVVRDVSSGQRRRPQRLQDMFPR